MAVYKELLNGLYGNHLKVISDINKFYDIYNGKQGWDISEELDYDPTQQVTNFIKKLIDTRARFMFGREPFFDIKQIKKDNAGVTTLEDEAQEKEDLLKMILDDNKFHSKILKARKDCSIGGKVAIKLWGHTEKGIKIIFVPAQEFFVKYDTDDIDEIEKVIFLYQKDNTSATHPEISNLSKAEQRFNKQEWEMINGRCILNEAIYDGNGKLIKVIEENHNTGLYFIPVIIIQNGGLTGETAGKSDVEMLWQTQNIYNRLSSDDVDALKFNMFPQKVSTDADELSLKNIVIAPSALIDLQTDMAQGSQGRQASLNNLETNFTYGDKFETTLDRHKNNMFELMNIPNIGLDQLKGLMTSGRSMKALYWDLMAVCDEDFTEWKPALRQMVEFIFRMIIEYNCYDARKIANYETYLDIITEYPLQEDLDEQKKIALEEVITGVRSRHSYINDYGDAENLDTELERIRDEKEQFSQDNYTRDLLTGFDDLDAGVEDPND